jgi:cytochrome P450
VVSVAQAPGPDSLPLVGILPDLVRQRGVLVAILNYWRTYGDVVQARLGTTTTLFFARPEGVQRILVDNRDNYPRSKEAIRSLAPMLGDGLVSSEGAHWRRQRHFMQGPFAVSAVPTYTPAIVSAVDVLLQTWDRRVQSGDVDLDMLKETSALTLDVLGRTIFGFDTRARALEVGEIFDEILDYMARHLYGMVPYYKWLPTPDNRRLERNLRHLDVLLDEMIGARRAAPDTYAFDTDLLSVMLRARDEWGEGMLERHLRDEVLTIYIAGHQTSAELIAWIFYVLADNPEAEARLHDELVAAPDLRQVERLPYLRMVVDETLRLYPTAPLVTKNARRADVVEGCEVPSGALVLLSPYVTHRHPAVWPDPDAFDPLRFTPERSEGRHRMAFWPFSAGYHSCIGMAFALLEVRLAVAAIARRFRFRRLPGPSVEPAVTSTLTPKGLRMRLEAW